jgi:hypothetical protein
MAISRLSTSNPSSNSDTLIYTGTRTILTSIIATNKSSDPATIQVWVVPLDQDEDPTKHVFIAYNAAVNGNDSLETFRFPVVIGDKVYVRASSGDISFMLSGIDDTTVTGMEYETLVNMINELASGASITISENPPAEPSEGNLWYNSNDGKSYIYYGTSWVGLI